MTGRRTGRIVAIPEEMASIANGLSRRVGEFVQGFKQVQTQLDSLDYEGQRAQAFYDSWEVQRKKFNDAIQMLQESSCELIQAANEFREADRPRAIPR